MRHVSNVLCSGRDIKHSDLTVVGVKHLCNTLALLLHIRIKSKDDRRPIRCDSLKEKVTLSERGAKQAGCIVGTLEEIKWSFNKNKLALPVDVQLIEDNFCLLGLAVRVSKSDIRIY